MRSEGEKSLTQRREDRTGGTQRENRRMAILEIEPRGSCFRLRISCIARGIFLRGRFESGSRTTNVQNLCVLRRFPLRLCLFGGDGDAADTRSSLALSWRAFLCGLCAFASEAFALVAALPRWGTPSHPSFPWPFCGAENSKGMCSQRAGSMFPVFETLTPATFRSIVGRSNDSCDAALAHFIDPPLALKFPRPPEFSR